MKRTMYDGTLKTEGLETVSVPVWDPTRLRGDQSVQRFMIHHRRFMLDARWFDKSWDTSIGKCGMSACSWDVDDLAGHMTTGCILAA